MQILEVRDETVVVRDDGGTVMVKEKTPYIEAKIRSGVNEKIEWNDGTLKIRERNEHAAVISDGCDISVTWAGETDIIWRLLSAVLCTDNKQNRNALEYYIHTLLDLSFIGVHLQYFYGMPIHIERTGLIIVPEHTKIMVMEKKTYHDGSRVVKIRFDLTHAQNIYNESILYALAGRDEIGQYWIHFVPPDFASRDIEACEVWLAGGSPGDTVIFSPRWQEVNTR